MGSIRAPLFQLADEATRRLAWLPATAARLTLGWVFLESGWGKLHNLEGVARFFSDLGIPAPAIQAHFVAGTEFVCGALLLVGLATRLAALPLVGVMLVAISTALSDRIEVLSDLFGLAEFCYIVLLAGLAIHGAGPLSVDALVAPRWRQRERSSSRPGKATPGREVHLTSPKGASAPVARSRRFDR